MTKSDSTFAGEIHREYSILVLDKINELLIKVTYLLNVHSKSTNCERNMLKGNRVVAVLFD